MCGFAGGQWGGGLPELKLKRSGGMANEVGCVRGLRVVCVLSLALSPICVWVEEEREKE